MDGAAGLGLAHFWSQADGVIRAAGWLLAAMSVLCWGLVFWKTWSWRRARRATRALPAFWTAQSIEAAIAGLKPVDPEGLFVPLAASAHAAATLPQVADTLAARTDRSELISRALRQRINEGAARLETGLTALASVGATAPFVGLFGTVWGIYHALLGIAAGGAITVERVAGPVGEALAMTALGIAVAIPAVLAYNAFARVNRLLLAELDGFAHDLHAYLTVGARLADEAGA